MHRGTQDAPPRLREETEAWDELTKAQTSLDFLLREATAAPQDIVQAVLKEPDFLRQLALVADRDRGTLEAALLQLRARTVKDRDIKALARAVNAERRKRRGCGWSSPGRRPSCLG